MTIIDRARDALRKATPGPWKRNGNKVWAGKWTAFECESESLTTMDNLLLAALAPEAAAAVVRVADLADWLDGKAEQWKAEGDDASAFDGHEVAARIRAAMEGETSE